MVKNKKKNHVDEMILEIHKFHHCKFFNTHFFPYIYFLKGAIINFK